MSVFFARLATLIGFFLLAPTAHADPDLSGVLRLTNGQGLAHACPIAMDQALTNRHVVGSSNRWVWGVGDGEEHHGIVGTDYPDQWRDLAVVRPLTQRRFPRWYEIAKQAPRIGEKVWFVGYDWSNRDAAFGAEVFESQVTRIFNGTLIFKAAGKPGSSGSCILNEQGQVIAINSGGMDTENQNGMAGIGVGVWGDWLSLRPDEPAVIEQSADESTLAQAFP